jgi:membrane protease YdiL (CAAX protease family)
MASQRALPRLAERAFPGLPWRSIWIAMLGTWLLVVYYHQGSPRAAPLAFIELSRRLTGIQAEMFHRHLWGHVSAVLLLMAIPLAVTRLSEGWRPAEMGLSIRGARREMLVVLGMWLALVPVIALAAHGASFQRTYPRLPEASADAGLFAVYEIAYLIKWTAWEFFFRGFLLFGFKKDLGLTAVLLSTMPFTIMHVGKPEAEMASAAIGGLVLCFIALRSRSIWPGVVIHALVAATMDFFASTWWR